MPIRILLPLLLCTTGCLLRDIQRHIDALDCEGGATDPTTGGETSGSTGCPDAETDTTNHTTHIETTTDEPGSTGPDSGDTSSTTSSTTGTTDATTDATTGEPVAVCGNGVVEPFGDRPEECDDSNGDPADGCSDCGRDRLVFITSVIYQGSLFKGLSGADQRCRSLADTQGLPNFAGFKAWLSDSATSAKQRMFAGRGRYVLKNGLVVADNWDALLAGALQNPINVTETMETKISGAWTGTLPDGSAAVGVTHCADWTGMLLKDTAYWGRSDLATSEWTIADVPDQPSDCGSELALYCFEQE